MGTVTVYTSNNNLGINTSNPTNRLSIVGGLSVLNNIQSYSYPNAIVPPGNVPQAAATYSSGGITYTFSNAGGNGVNAAWIFDGSSNSITYFDGLGSYNTGAGGVYGGTAPSTSNISGAWLQTLSSAPFILTSYAFSSTSQGVKEWYVFGSSDGTTWTQLDRVALSSWTYGTAITTFNIANPTAQYSYYRFVINKGFSGAPVVNDFKWYALTSLSTVGGSLLICASNSSEQFEFSGGNAKFYQNVYTLSNMAVGKSNPAYTLDVAGTAFISGNTVIGGTTTLSNNLYVLNPTSLSNTLDVSGRINLSNALTVTSNLWVNGATSLSNNLNVFGSATISNITALQSNLVVAGTTTLSNNLYALNPTSLSNTLDVSGRINLSNALTVTSNLWVNGATSLSNNLNVFGSATISNITALQSNLVVAGTTTLSNNLYVLNPTSLSNTLDVSGRINLSNALTVTSNLWVNGATSLSNNLNVYGSATISNITALQSNLVVAGTTTLSNNLYVLNPTSLSNTLDVSGRINLSNALTVTSNLWVNGATSLSNNLNVYGSATISNITALQSNLVVAGTTTLSNNLYVLNPTSLSNTLDVSGRINFSNALTVTSNLWVNGATSLSNNLNVFGSATISNITALQSNLVVAGTTTLSNNLYVLNPTSLSNTLDVSGRINFSNALTVTSNLWVNGATSLSNNLNVFGSATISNITALQSNLVVAGTTTLSNNLYVLNPTSLSNTLDVSGRINLSNALTVTSNLWVNGATSLSNNLNVFGSATISNITALQSNLVVAGTTTLSNNLYALSKLGVGTTTPSVIVEIVGSDAMLIPKGTTPQRPSVPALGHVRYNTDTSQFEGFGAGSAWGSLGGVKSTDQKTFVSAEMYPTSNDGNIRFVNSNAENMRITTAGRVGIATSNPSELVDIVGNTKVGSNLYVMANVGIGTSNPVQNLDIIGSTRVTGTFISAGSCIIRKAQGAVDTSNAFQFYGVNGLSNNGSNLYLQANNAVILQSGLLNEVARFRTGRVDITGDVNFTGTLYNNNVAFSGGGSSQWSTNGAAVTLLGSNVGIGTSNPSYPLHVVAGSNSTSIFAAGDIIGLSDASVKTDLKKITDAVSKVNCLNGYTFRRTDMGDSMKRSAGVIAQEVNDVFPEVITQMEDGKLSVAYGNITALLIEAIKELKADNDQLRARIDILEKRVF
jgi:acyl-[acyl carrier protein]--UDP-N-acetylglucosamine O-acyltransferase